MKRIKRLMLFCLACSLLITPVAKAKACDTTFANSQISAKHISGISRRINKAPRLIQTSWNYCASSLVFYDTKYKDGLAKYSWSNGISIDLDADSKAKMKYSDVFHEVGHHVAYTASYVVLGKQGKSISDNYISKKYHCTLNQMLKREGKKYFKKVRKKTKSNKKAWRKIRKELRRYSDKYSYEVSDIWDGVSNGKAYAYCGHSMAADYPDYWDSTSVGNEAFADMYEASIVNKKGLKLIKKYFPKSYKIFLEELRLLK